VRVRTRGRPERDKGFAAPQTLFEVPVFGRRIFSDHHGLPGSYERVKRGERKAQGAEKKRRGEEGGVNMESHIS